MRRPWTGPPLTTRILLVSQRSVAADTTSSTR
jgi:hypothetical protein